MSEQLNPYTGEAVAVAPLTWSHAEFVLTVISYLVKLEDLGICQACYDLT
jgi:GH15 family glucan-1,4-alpha-glucosidase